MYTAYTYVCKDGCMYVCTFKCMFVYICMYVCMYVCMNTDDFNHANKTFKCMYVLYVCMYLMLGSLSTMYIRISIFRTRRIRNSVHLSCAIGSKFGSKMRLTGAGQGYKIQRILDGCNISESTTCYWDYTYHLRRHFPHIQLRSTK